jgi:hypothetical protein
MSSEQVALFCWDTLPMPWIPADAHRHKKGLSAKQARQWSTVANNILATCLAKGGAQSACEGRAIRGANSAVGEPVNARQYPHLHTNHAHHFTVNATLTAQPSRLTVHAREYLVAPAVLIVEGVLNQGFIAGAMLLPDHWESMPVCLDHPCDAAGEPISARDPVVLETWGIGHLDHARIGSGLRQHTPVQTLQADIWLDIARIEALGGAALQAMARIEAGEVIELSTGFYAEAIPAQGQAYGTLFTEILTNLQPDHLALLPNSIGACSLADGCGCPRLNHAGAPCACPDRLTCTCEESPMPSERPRGWRGFVQLLREFVIHESDPIDEENPDASTDTAPRPEETEAEAQTETMDEAALTAMRLDTELREALTGAFLREQPTDYLPCYIEGVDAVNQYCIIRHGDRLTRRYWTMTDGIVTLLPEVEDVQRESTFLTVPPTAPAPEGYAMALQAPPLTIKMRVNALIQDGERTGWTEKDRHILEQFDEVALLRLEQQPLRPAQLREPTTLEEALQYVPAQFREPLFHATQAYETRKRKLIEVITANKLNPFAPDELASMPADRLEQLVIMAGDEVPETGLRPVAQQTYQGRRMPQLRVVQEESETIPPPPNTLSEVVRIQRERGLRA